MSVPGFHGATVNHFGVDILACLGCDHQRLDASIHQQDVPNTHIIYEAIIVHTDAVVSAVCTLLNCEGEVVPCKVAVCQASATMTARSSMRTRQS